MHKVPKRMKITSNKSFFSSRNFRCNHLNKNKYANIFVKTPFFCKKVGKEIPLKKIIFSIQIPERTKYFGCFSGPDPRDKSGGHFWPIFLLIFWKSRTQFLDFFEKKKTVWDVFSYFYFSLEKKRVSGAKRPQNAIFSSTARKSRILDPRTPNFVKIWRAPEIPKIDPQEAKPKKGSFFRFSAKSGLMGTLHFEIVFRECVKVAIMGICPKRVDLTCFSRIPGPRISGGQRAIFGHFLAIFGLHAPIFDDFRKIARGLYIYKEFTLDNSEKLAQNCAKTFTSFVRFFFQKSQLFFHFFYKKVSRICINFGMILTNFWPFFGPKSAPQKFPIRGRHGHENYHFLDKNGITNIFVKTPCF